MATISQMIANRLPDEAVLFSSSLDSYIEEATALAGLEGTAESGMSVLQKSLVADMAAKEMILPAMSQYKKAMSSAEGEGAGKAEFVDKLAFLDKMDKKLSDSILEKKSAAGAGTDTGVPMEVVTDE